MSSRNPPRKATKETGQSVKLATEILRMVISRSEDITMLKAISDKKTGRLRLQSALAEKSLQEAEYKEDWRLTKEDSVLLQLFSTRIEDPTQKKLFEKLARKIQRVNLQFEDEVGMGTSEAHVHRIMNAKIGPLLCANDNQGAVVNAMAWRDQYDRSTKILESCFYGDVLAPYNALSYCAQRSRGNFCCELNRQWQALEEAALMNAKQAKGPVNFTRKNLAPTKKNAHLPEPEWVGNMVKMMLELNTEASRTIAKFKAEFCGAAPALPTPKTYDLAYKTHRTRNYERYCAVNPLKNWVPQALTFERFQVSPEILFDIENAYFEEQERIEDRVLIIHSCIVIQKAVIRRKHLLFHTAAVAVQKAMRMFLGTIKILKLKMHGLRKTFFTERLRHWYPLAVNNWKIRRAKFVPGTYTEAAAQILTIQRIVRGCLARRLFRQKRELLATKRAGAGLAFYKKKQSLWKLASDFEKDALNQSQVILETLVSGKLQILSSSENKDLLETANKLQRNEIQYRKEYLHKARIKRLEFLE